MRRPTPPQRPGFVDLMDRFGPTAGIFLWALNRLLPRRYHRRRQYEQACKCKRPGTTYPDHEPGCPLYTRGLE